MRYICALVVFLLLFLAIGLVFDRESFLFALPLEKKKRIESEKIKESILNFNTRYMDVYASQGSAETIDIIPATTEMRHRMFKDVGYLRFSSRVLVYDMASMEIDSVKQSGPFNAEAVTTEAWNYVYQDSKTREPISPIKGMDARFRYRLIKKEGKWLVYRYFPVREEDGDEEAH